MVLSKLKFSSQSGSLSEKSVRMRLPGKCFIAASQRQSASLSDSVCPLQVYTHHPVALSHFEPFPAAFTWMLMK